MRILYICRSPIEPGTVTETHVLGVAAAWAAEGHAVTLWTPAPPRGSPVTSRFLTLSRWESRIPLCWAGGIRPMRPDRVYARWCVSEGPALTAAARRLNVPCFVEINGILTEELPAWNVAGRFFARRAERLTVSRATGLVVPTSGVRTYLGSAHGIPPERILAVGNGVDPVHFAPREARDCRARLGLDPSFRYVGFVGNFQPWHGTDLLVEAFAGLSRDRPDLRLILVGDGPARAALEQLIQRLGCQGRLIWRGRAARADVPLWVGASDVCAVPWTPVRSDPGSSVKLLEYMACARPVVATDVPEYAEPIQKAGGGRVAPVGDAEGFAAALGAVLDAPESERRAMGERNRRYILENRTWAHVGAEILAFMGGV